MYTSLDSMGKVSLMMDLISQRQRALGSNVANVDTPGYLRQDISFGQYLSTMNSPLETQLSEKLGPSAVITEQSDDPINPANELLQMQENAILYSMATRRMSNIVTVDWLKENLNNDKVVIIDCRFSLMDKEYGKKKYENLFDIRITGYVDIFFCNDL